PGAGAPRGLRLAVLGEPELLGIGVLERVEEVDRVHTVVSGRHRGAAELGYVHLREHLLVRRYAVVAHLVGPARRIVRDPLVVPPRGIEVHRARTRSDAGRDDVGHVGDATETRV